MPSLTIRNLELETKNELRRRAAEHGHSMQEEARRILRVALDAPSSVDESSLYKYIRSLVEPLGGIDDLVIPPRDVAHDPPSFD